MFGRAKVAREPEFLGGWSRHGLLALSGLQDDVLIRPSGQACLLGVKCPTPAANLSLY